MGSVVGLGGYVEAVDNALPFLNEKDATALSEAVMAPKPPPRPIAIMPDPPLIFKKPPIKPKEGRECIWYTCHF